MPFTMKTHKTMLKNQSVFSYPWVARIFWIRLCRFSLRFGLRIIGDKDLCTIQSQPGFCNLHIATNVSAVPDMCQVPLYRSRFLFPCMKIFVQDQQNQGIIQRHTSGMRHNKSQINTEIVRKGHLWIENILLWI